MNLKRKDAAHPESAYMGAAPPRRRRGDTEPAGRRRRRGLGAGIAVLACALGLTAAGALSATPGPAAHAAIRTAADVQPAAAAADITQTAKTTVVPATHVAGTPSFGPNVYVFTPSMPQSQIQATVDAIATQQIPNQFGTQRYALLFEPGTYGSGP